jgi:hypothetical protein
LKPIKDYLATVGRALIKEQQQAALANIQKNKEAALNELDLKYASADKAKKSFGFIGIAFLAVLFGSVFLNDILKLFIYYCSELKIYWRRKKIENKLKLENNTQDTTSDIRIEMDLSYVANQELEEALEKVYIRLLTAKKKRTHRRKQSNK